MIVLQIQYLNEKKMIIYDYLKIKVYFLVKNDIDYLFEISLANFSQIYI